MPRSPGEWTEDDLLLLIRDSVEEGPDLEYKRCAALKKDDPQRREISKDVSAMANSAGGTIICGMVEKKIFQLGWILVLIQRTSQKSGWST